MFLNKHMEAIDPENHEQPCHCEKCGCYSPDLAICEDCKKRMKEAKLCPKCGTPTELIKADEYQDMEEDQEWCIKCAEEIKKEGVDKDVQN